MKASRPDIFDRSRLRVLPLSERKHDADLGVIMPLAPMPCHSAELATVAARVRAARDRGAAVVLMLGAHALKTGVQRYVIDLMEKGWVSCVALNGAGVVHDYEFALIGASTESVARYIAEGQFGLWEETGRINDVVAAGAKAGAGFGEAVGRAIEKGRFPRRDISILAAGCRTGVPVTVHVSIGYDIVHEHPNCDGAAYGATSYTDFLRFAKVLERLEGGVVMSFGSAVMAPEVYLKALAMVRNVAQQESREVRHFATLVCDLVALPKDFHCEAPKTDPGYYYRPWKTMLVRTVADGGESFYVRAPHRETMPMLWTEINRQAGSHG